MSHGFAVGSLPFFQFLREVPGHGWSRGARRQLDSRRSAALPAASGGGAACPGLRAAEGEAGQASGCLRRPGHGSSSSRGGDMRAAPAAVGCRRWRGRTNGAGEAAQGGEVEGVASLAWGGGERERAAHGGHGSTTDGHGCNSEREGESRASECQREPEGARALGFHYRRAQGRDRGRPRGNGALQWREHAHAWSSRTGHAASVGAFPRTPGERRSEHGGA